MSTANGKKYFADEFVVTGGTSSDYLMGDGTLSTGASGNTTIGTDTDLTTSGATVVDDITLTDGVVISHTTRTLTLANLGYTGATNANNYTHPTYSTTNINTSGSTIVDSITTNSTGHITAMGTRTLTLANLGYTGDTDANNYVLPFTDNSSNWNTAFGWGDHSTEGYLTSSSTQSKYLRSDAADTATGLLTLNGGIDVLSGTGGGKLRVRRNSYSTDGDDIMDIHMDDGGSYFDIDNDGDSDAGNFAFRYKTGGSFSNLIYFSPTTINYKSNTIWHGGNDGSGSGLDADKLDAQEGSYYLDYDNFTNTPNLWDLTAQKTGINIDTEGADNFWQYSHATQTTDGTHVSSYQYVANFGDKSKGIQLSHTFGSSSNNLYFRSGSDNASSENGANTYSNWRRILTTTDSSSGNWGGTFDGQEGSYYLDYNNFTNTPTIPSAYTHPTHNGDDISVDTGALTGAVVISDLDFNVTTDTLGHVTDANAAISTRTLTLANLGFTGDADANNYTHPSYNGDDFSIDTTPLTGATVISDLDINITTDGTGHVTDANGSVNTRTLTLADLGYTGDTDANNTTARTDEEIRDVAAAQWVNGANTTVVYDDTANTIKINAPAGGVVDGSGVQNYLVKWTDSDTLTDSIMHETNDRVGINVIQTNATFAVSKTGDETMLFEPNVSNGGRNSLSNFDFSDNSYVGMNYDGLDHEFKTSGVTKLTIANTTIETPNSIEADSFIKDGGTSSQYLMADGSVSTGGASGIDGSGTVKMIPKFSDSDTLTDSNIFEANGGEVHINTTTEMPGMLNVYQDTTDPALILLADDGGSSASPILYMSRDSSSPANDDVLGRINFAGNNSATTDGSFSYAKLEGFIDNVTAGATNGGGIHLQSKLNTTFYTNLRTRGSRSYADNTWYFSTEIQAEGGIEIYTGSTISLDNDSGTSGEVLVSKGSSTTPEWEHRVRSNTSEGGTGSVQVGNIVKITQSAYTALGSKDADTIYIIVG